MSGTLVFGQVDPLREGPITKPTPEWSQLEMDPVDVSLQLAVTVEVFPTVRTDSSTKGSTDSWGDGDLFK